jgi:predicted nucleotidyltransferase
MTELATAEAVFGSVSRGDHDALSDRDVLLVDDDTQLLNRRQADLEAEGSSVASYTFRKLDILAQRGALFIQHLKAEAEIQRDVGGRLRSTLDAFRPKRCYQDDLAENAQLAGLAAVRPNTGAGALWAADVLYVAIRNFGVLHLAQKGTYVFSYSRVLEALTDDRIITPTAVADLLKLRWAKSLYRSGQEIPLEAATEIVRRAIEARPDPLFPSCSIELGPIEILSRSVELPNGSPAYHRLRNLERSYLALQAIYPADSVSEDLGRLLTWIENPRAYAFLAGRLEPDLILLMKSAGSDYRCRASVAMPPAGKVTRDRTEQGLATASQIRNTCRVVP